MKIPAMIPIFIGMPSRTVNLSKVCVRSTGIFVIKTEEEACVGNPPCSC